MALTPQQIAARQFRIGGSELAAIMGDNPYCSPYELWARKTNRLRVNYSDEENEAIELGNMIEPLLMNWFEIREGKPIERGIEVASDDGLVVAILDGKFYDNSAVVEAKTSMLAGWSRKMADQWTRESFPRYYWWQTQAQMHAAKIPKAFLIALIGGRGRIVYEVEYDPDTTKAALEVAREWWDLHVAFDQEPLAVPPKDAETIRRMHANIGEAVILTDDDMADVDRANELSDESKELAANAKAIKDAMACKMGDATEGLLPDGRLITFREKPVKGYWVAPRVQRELRLPKTIKPIGDDGDDSEEFATFE